MEIGDRRSELVKLSVVAETKGVIVNEWVNHDRQFRHVVGDCLDLVMDEGTDELVRAHRYTHAFDAVHLNGIVSGFPVRAKDASDDFLIGTVL